MLQGGRSYERRFPDFLAKICVRCGQKRVKDYPQLLMTSRMLTQCLAMCVMVLAPVQRYICSLSPPS